VLRWLLVRFKRVAFEMLATSEEVITVEKLCA
jgi:hypothetical protein